MYDFIDKMNYFISGYDEKLEQAIEYYQYALDTDTGHLFYDRGD